MQQGDEAEWQICACNKANFENEMRRCAFKANGRGKGEVEDILVIILKYYQSIEAS